MSNRAERRRKMKEGKSVAKDPVYTFHRSELLGFIKQMVKTDPEVRRIIQEQAEESVLKEGEKQNRDVDIIILFTLNEIYGFHNKRLLKFAKGITMLHNYFDKFYEDPEITPFAMERHLKMRGIDVDRILEEAENYEQDSDKG